MFSLACLKMEEKQLNPVIVLEEITMTYGSILKTEIVSWLLMTDAPVLPMTAKPLNGWSCLSLRCTTHIPIIKFLITFMATVKTDILTVDPVIVASEEYHWAIGGHLGDVNPDSAYQIRMIIILSGPAVMMAAWRFIMCALVTPAMLESGRKQPMAGHQKI